MKKLVNFLFFILLLPISAFTAEPPSANSSLGSQDNWVATMQHDLPKALCQPQHYFMKCFNVTEAQCLEATSLYVKGCLDNILIALPPELNKEQGEKWGQMVGRCSFDLYEKFMQPKKRKLSECDLK